MPFKFNFRISFVLRSKIKSAHNEYIQTRHKTFATTIQTENCIVLNVFFFSCTNRATELKRKPIVLVQLFQCQNGRRFVEVAETCLRFKRIYRKKTTQNLNQTKSQAKVNMWIGYVVHTIATEYREFIIVYNTITACEWLYMDSKNSPGHTCISRFT